MKQTVNEYTFRDAFSIRPNSFSYEALGAMFEYFEQLEDDIGEEMELDPIAICCDYAEYTLEEINQEYGESFDDLNQVVEWLGEQTIVIPVNDESVVIQSF